jgi:hypothetical protein
MQRERKVNELGEFRDEVGDLNHGTVASKTGYTKANSEPRYQGLGMNLMKSWIMVRLVELYDDMY